jgi:hypothetical protein
MNFFKQVSWVSLGASPHEFLGFGGFLGASVATRKTMIYGKVKDNCFKNSKWMMMHVTNQRVLCFSSSSSWGEEERDDAKLHSQSRFHCLLNYTYVPLSTTAI